mmetsp:Transcript_17400/g.41388  ORF Transcript_17400/g.41388 Transcript_17400/m.41388 type:complete len:231 (+) Transcript_17400:190-882(+)
MPRAPVLHLCLLDLQGVLGGNLRSGGSPGALGVTFGLGFRGLRLLRRVERPRLCGVGGQGEVGDASTVLELRIGLREVLLNLVDVRSLLVEQGRGIRACTIKRSRQSSPRLAPRQLPHRHNGLSTLLRMLGDLVSDVDVLEVYRRIRGRPFEVHIWVQRRRALRMRGWVLCRWALRMHGRDLCGMAEPDSYVSVELCNELLVLSILQSELLLFVYLSVYLEGKLFIRTGC